MRHLFSGRRDDGHPTSSDHAAPRHPRRRVAIVTALLAFAVAGSPGAALASSLLSGYGGPGEGSEAIIGSTLVNGPSGGAGGGSAGAGGSPVSGTAGSGRGPSASPNGELAGRSASASAGARGIGGRARRATGAGNGTAATGAGSSGTAFAAQAADRGNVESEHLGLTAQDLIYVLLVLAALAAVWALTAHLARTSADGALSGAKGTAQGTRLKP